MMQILVVDPINKSREALAQMLAEMTFDPVPARDGMEAWQILQSKTINLVISEWVLPRVTGLELCKKIRTIQQDEYIYLFVLVGKDEVSNLKEIFQSGADDCLIKPINSHILNARLKSGERIIQLGQKNKELHNTMIQSRNKLRIVFDALPEEIVATDLNGCIQSMNRAYVKNRNTGFSDVWKQQIKAEDLYFMEKFDKSIFSASFKSVIQTGKPVAIKDLLTRQGDVEQHKEIHFLPVKDETRKIKQIIIVARDITE